MNLSLTHMVKYMMVAVSVIDTCAEFLRASCPRLLTCVRPAVRSRRHRRLVSVRTCLK